jgi:hypothetical protein
MDKNKGGMILFEEFCSWAYANNLDVENFDKRDDSSDSDFNKELLESNTI